VPKRQLDKHGEGGLIVCDYYREVEKARRSK